MRLTKHHGLGNDFLVHLDLDGVRPIDAATAISVCDRHRGIGADGIVRCTRGAEQPFRFELRNEDGSTAEMSGNGLSCLAQALVLGGHATRMLTFETPVGVRAVEVVGQPDQRVHEMKAFLGSVAAGDPAPEWESDQILRTLHVDVGNPHLVCHVPDADDRPDLVRLGRRVNDVTPGGINVELVSPAADGVDMWVYERGVGPTTACGTGAVASAVAARHWGLAGASVVVHQPGGDAVVDLGEGAWLTVPVEAVAQIEWPHP